MSLPASIDALEAWARQIMASIEPQFCYGGNNVRKWIVEPDLGQGELCVHELTTSDDGDELHGHPHGYTSYIVHGRYIEVGENGELLHSRGDQIVRRATDLHRIKLVDDEVAITIFVSGARQATFAEAWR